jgi:hypothetical protein
MVYEKPSASHFVEPPNQQEQEVQLFTWRCRIGSLVLLVRREKRKTGKEAGREEDFIWGHGWGRVGGDAPSQLGFVSVFCL